MTFPEERKAIAIPYGKNGMVRVIMIPTSTIHDDLTTDEQIMLNQFNQIQSDKVKISKLEAQVAQLREALEGMHNIYLDSPQGGIVGYHLNGDIAFWSEFGEIEIAETALADTQVRPAFED